MRYGVRSDKGLVREINEDCYNVIGVCDGLPVSFVVADGMGGHNSGEVASRMAVDSVSRELEKLREGQWPESSIPQLLQDVFNKANLAIYNKSLEKKQDHGMGTTLTVAVVYERKVYIGHVGDSRVYLVRNGSIERITVDHSLTEELVRNGMITREEAESHPSKNIITRAVGCLQEMQADVYIREIQENDLFILCTDGLTNMLDDSEILELVQKFDDPQEACDELTCIANERGGADNITVIIFKEG